MLAAPGSCPGTGAPSDLAEQREEAALKVRPGSCCRQQRSLPGQGCEVPALAMTLCAPRGRGRVTRPLPHPKASWGDAACVETWRAGAARGLSALLSELPVWSGDESCGWVLRLAPVSWLPAPSPVPSQAALWHRWVLDFAELRWVLLAGVCPPTPGPPVQQRGRGEQAMEPGTGPVPPQVPAVQ